MSLEDYGYGSFFASAFEAQSRDGLVPGRVLQSGTPHRIVTDSGIVQATLPGRMRQGGLYPAVGDFVAVDLASERVATVLPRKSKLSRKAAGKRTEEQVVAANVDTVFVVMGLDADFNPRRLERYLTSIWESGATPVVLLNKADLATGHGREELEDVTLGVTVVEMSALTGAGTSEVLTHLRPRETSVLVGSSGAGKSTLINRLLGRDAQATSNVREGDDRGRHTTTHRELFVLPGGALLVDSPGIRELALWSGTESLDRAFADVAELAESCRFTDCRHESEPGCAVLDAAASGELGNERLESYRSLQKELDYLERRQSESAQRLQKQKWKAIHKEMRRSGKHRRT